VDEMHGVCHHQSRRGVCMTFTAVAWRDIAETHFSKKVAAVPVRLLWDRAWQERLPATTNHAISC